MYNAIVSTVNELILTNSAISGVIPCGTAIQNLRTSPLGDTLTRDGYHLSKGVGRYTAALTYLAYITGIDIDSISAIPTNHPEIEGYLDYVKEAVGAAIEAPYSVTKSQYAPEDKEDELLPSTLSPLSKSDKAYLSANGYSPDEYMLLDLTITPNAYYNSLTDSNLVIPSSSASKYNQYLATQIFTKAELPYGSLIRLDSGYKYRPDAWIDLEKNTTRPAQVSTNLVEINSSWWGDYTHRGFNISKSNEGTITAAEAESFKIYIKVVKRSTLTDADRDFLTSNGYNADEYMVLDFDYYLNAYYNSSTGSNLVTNANNCAKYLTTEYFSRYDLTLGSIIRLTASGYSYRPDAWVDLNDKNPNRPANTGASVTVVDASWWQSYTCRVFNLSRSDSAQIQDSDVSALRIYVKIP